MINKLRVALLHLCKARAVIKFHLTEDRYSMIREDLGSDIKSLQTIITNLKADEPTPTEEAIPHGS